MGSFYALNFQEMKRLAQSQSTWIYNLGLSCCLLEVQAAFGPRYDLGRFGVSMVSNPSNADVLIVAGPLTRALEKDVLALYESMPSPKYVISMGSCANTGGAFHEHGYGVAKGVDRILPVDIYIPGCPPRPESIIHAILRLQSLRRNPGTEVNA